MKHKSAMPKWCDSKTRHNKKFDWRENTVPSPTDKGSMVLKPETGDQFARSGTHLAGEEPDQIRTKAWSSGTRFLQRDPIKAKFWAE